MFGRKKKQAADVTAATDDTLDAVETTETAETDAVDAAADVDDEPTAAVAEETDAESGDDAGSDDSEESDGDSDEADGADEEADGSDEDEDEEEVDEWEDLQTSRDWRDDGPFDLTEVELEGDEVERMDFGSLILTPTEGLQLQLQVDQETNAVQAALAMLGNSGLEVALFAAPNSGGLAKTVREEMLASVGQTGGTCEFAEGPFGAEVRRIVPVRTPEGEDAIHVSRVWLAEGPRWLLRGVLMGEACVSEDPAAQADFVEFFKNIVVRRGDEPLPPGDLIPMTLPEGLQPAPAPQA